MEEIAPVSYASFVKHASSDLRNPLAKRTRGGRRHMGWHQRGEPNTYHTYPGGMGVSSIGFEIGRERKVEPRTLGKRIRLALFEERWREQDETELFEITDSASIGTRSFGGIVSIPHSRASRCRRHVA